MIQQQFKQQVSINGHQPGRCMMCPSKWQRCDFAFAEKAKRTSGSVRRAFDRRRRCRPSALHHRIKCPRKAGTIVSRCLRSVADDVAANRSDRLACTESVGVCVCLCVCVCNGNKDHYWSHCRNTLLFAVCCCTDPGWEGRLLGCCFCCCCWQRCCQTVAAAQKVVHVRWHQLSG